MNYVSYPNKKALPSRKQRKTERNRVYTTNYKLNSKRAKKASRS